MFYVADKLFRDLGCILAGTVKEKEKCTHHRKVLQPAELWPAVSSAKFEEEEQSDDDCGDDEG